jgi:Putative MetA-pathway of phenol degradation
MPKQALLLALITLLWSGSALAQNGPCGTQSNKLACALPQEFGPNLAFSSVLGDVGRHPAHFSVGTSDFGATIKPLTQDISRQVNLLPIASPSSGIVLVYDKSINSFTTATDSLGPVLGERAETVGRHHLFVGFSYQFFNFDKLDGIDLHNFPAVLTHTDDSTDNSGNGVTNNCSLTTAKNLGGCAFVRDRIDTINAISLKVNQYTTYVTFGLTKKVDVSMVIPIENVRMSLSSQATIVPGSNGMITPQPGSPDSMNDNQIVNGVPVGNGAPYFFHLWKNCPNTSPAGGAALDPSCLNHTFPDAAFAGGGPAPSNSATGIGDVVARVKWNAWEGERAGFAAGMDIRFATGDAVNYLGSGSYGFKPFAVFSYRARISPHALVGYEWNTDSITAGDLTQGTKGKLPNDFTYTVGADAKILKYLTGNFDIVGQRIFGADTVSEVPQGFLAFCGACTANPNPATVTLNSLRSNPNQSYNVTNASIGIKARILPKVSRLVFTANVLVRLDDGGLSSKPAPLFGLGYTF